MSMAILVGNGGDNSLAPRAVILSEFLPSMARSRPSSALARLFQAADRPLYVVSTDYELVFANQSCLDWLALPPDGVLGGRCRFHTPPGGAADATLAGLCPPPSAWEEPVSEAILAVPASDGSVRRRHASFVRLGNTPAGAGGLLVLLATADLTGEEAESAWADEPESVRLHEEVRRFRQELAGRFRIDRLVGDGPAMRLARAQVQAAAASRASVLIVGPPGSGRQHVAAAIHYASPGESAGRLAPLSCGLLGSDLIRATVRALAGSASAEARGTLVLNEADQIPADVQAELAEWFARPGFPLRVISVARRPLANLVRRERFREDLACALSTITIRLPSLAQRRADIPALAQLFLEDLNAREATQRAGFASEVLERLAVYDWPGNLGELAEMVAGMHRSAAGSWISLSDLPQRMHWVGEAAARPRVAEESIVLDEYLARIERELIERALNRAKGNKAKAARLLGLNRPRLYRRMLQLGLTTEED